MDKCVNHKDCKQLDQGGFYSRCYRGSVPLKTESIFKESIGINGGIPQKRNWVEVRMQDKEVKKHWF